MEGPFKIFCPGHCLDKSEELLIEKKTQFLSAVRNAKRQMEACRDQLDTAERNAEALRAKSLLPNAPDGKHVTELMNAETALMHFFFPRYRSWTSYLRALSRAWLERYKPELLAESSAQGLPADAGRRVGQYTVELIRNETESRSCHS